jgi:hypothetical protein
MKKKAGDIRLILRKWYRLLVDLEARVDRLQGPNRQKQKIYDLFQDLNTVQCRLSPRC